MTNKLKIPKRFKLLGETITVRYCNDMLLNGSYGMASYKNNEIVLQDTNTPVEKREHTFYHELTHHILSTMGEDKICSNEKFVDVFSGLLHQAIQTSEY